MRLPFKGLFIFTQDYGVNPELYKRFLVLYPDGKRYPMKGHNGLDFACPTRTEIVAPHDGTIKEATSDPNGYGYYVKIENEEEGSVLAHLDSIDAQVGFQLREGDHIGWSDNTGYSTAPHCHWGWYPIPRDRSNGLAGFYDQKPLLAEAGIHLAVGQLPVIDPTKATNTEPDLQNTGSNYKGLDITNKDSMKAAIDAWYDVAHGAYVKKEEYNELNTQLETVRKQLEETQKADSSNSPSLQNYKEFAALGYNTVDDFNKVLKAKDDSILALQKEVSTVRQRNSVLAGEIEKIENEDHTAADLGIQLQDRVKELEHSLSEVAKITGVEKPTLNNIVSQIFRFKDLSDKFLSMIEEKQKEKEVATVDVKKSDNLKTPQESSLSWLLKLLSLNPKGKGVA